MAAPARGFCTVISLPHPIARAGGGTSTLRLSVAAPLALVWADGGTDTYGPGAHGAAVSVYDGTTTSVDGHADVWLILASHGTANLWLVKELDFEQAATLLGALTSVTAGEWAPLYRVDGDSIEKLDQLQPDLSKFVELDPAAGTPQEGDLIYSHSGKWELLHLPTGGGDGDVLTSNGTDPSWQFLAYALGKLLALTGQIAIGGGSGAITILNPGNDGDLLTTAGTGGAAAAWRDLSYAISRLCGLPTNGDLLHYNGSAWSYIHLPGSPPPAGDIYALTSNGPGNIGWSSITFP